MTMIWPRVIAHPTGGLWIEDARALLIADLHLGYGWAQRRRGQLGPVEDQTTQERISQVVAELSPTQIVLLGDIVHAPHPAPEERAWIEGILSELKDRLVCVRGNHDRGFLKDFPSLGISLLEDWRFQDLRAVHGDRLPQAIPDGERWILGHWHPAIRIEDAGGAGRKFPAFVATERLIVMPAFSPFAAGVDVWRSLPGEIARLCGGADEHGPGDPTVVAVTGKRTVALGPLSGFRSPAADTRPSRFQRRSRKSKK